jgi:starch phosphorylase
MYRDMNVDRQRLISYFSMEIALESSIPTYSGGLGVLSGDILRSAADMEIPIVAVTLVFDKGYFYQILDGTGEQKEYGFEWDYASEFEQTEKKVKLNINGKEVSIGAWFYPIIGRTGYIVPVYLLDTNLDENDDEQRNFTRLLYDTTPDQRLIQEIILGMGGVKMLQELGFSDIDVFHINEGHSAMVTLELLKKFNDISKVKKRCVFTTHTPVPAGHDRFNFGLVRSILGTEFREELVDWCGEYGQLNMTKLAIHFSRFINGVSKKHREVTLKMFPNENIDYITNGIHIYTWLNPILKKLFLKYFHALIHNIEQLTNAVDIDPEDLWDVHKKIKKELVNYSNTHSWLLLDENMFTIGFARRITEYKRPTLIFNDLDRLGDICQGKAQILMSGKTHPKDYQGKELIKEIFNASKYLWSEYRVRVVFLENYNLDLAKLMVSGVDLWLNNPRRYTEASGTSGMKAALNGVPNFSVLDGWWIEGYERSNGMAGWAIGPGPEYENAENLPDEFDAMDIYEKLEKKILPMFFNKRDSWIERMKHAITLGAYFNTRRVINEYATKSWNLRSQKKWKYIG